MYTYGFIGTGNMGGVVASAVCKCVDAQKVYLANRTAQKAKLLAEKLGCHQVDNETVFETCDFIFLGVKPYMIKDLLSGAKEILNKREKVPVLISMAAGVKIEQMEAVLDGTFPIIRIMPNTPAAVGEGMTMYAVNSHVTKEQLNTFLCAMEKSGRLDALEEHLIDAASAVAGCGPAYAYMMIEALADGGVECGLPRGKAMVYAAQMLLGSAKNVLESGAHPGELKDAVCSPGGSTIAGVHALEAGKFRGTVMDAVKAACEKNKKLG